MDSFKIKKKEYMGFSVKKNEEEQKDDSTDPHFPSSTRALLIFTRNPELGKCKTRLAKTIGDEDALSIYKELLSHTASVTDTLKVDKFVYYSENIAHEDNWDDSIYTKRLQKGNDLGEKMQNAFSLLFSSGYKEVVIIGSDLYDLSQQDLQNAFEKLQKNDFVLGPAEDGGYYLLGMKKFLKKLFENKEWSSDQVLKDSLADLQDESYALLEERNDIDHYEDLTGIPELEKLLTKSI